MALYRQRGDDPLYTKDQLDALWSNPYTNGSEALRPYFVSAGYLTDTRESATSTGIPGSGSPNSTPFPGDTPQSPAVPRYSGPNYSAQIAALKKGGERTAPILIDQYTQQLKDLGDNQQFYQQMADDAIANAKDAWRQADYAQYRVGDDIWYRATQKFQNSWNQHSDAMNGQYGSLLERRNNLYNLTDDQMDQENLASIKAGMMTNQQNFANTYNQTMTGLDQNNMSVYQQMRDVIRQGGSALTNYVNELLSGLVGYGDKTYQNAKGDITNAGWNWLKQFGVINDGTGKFKFDESIFKPELPGGVSMADYLGSLKESNHPLWTIDYLPNVRSAQETRDYVRGQAGRNERELGKISNESAPADYYATQQKRYG